MTNLRILAIILSVAVVAWGCRSGRITGSQQHGAAVPTSPRIVSVSTQPKLQSNGGWLMLPPGKGEIQINVSAKSATRVKVFFVPSGTDQRKNARLIGEDNDGKDGWFVRWQFPNEDIMGYLLVQAVGPGGVAEDESLQVYHEKMR